MKKKIMIFFAASSIIAVTLGLVFSVMVINSAAELISRALTAVEHKNVSTYYEFAKSKVNDPVCRSGLNQVLSLGSLLNGTPLDSYRMIERACFSIDPIKDSKGGYI